MFLTRSLNGKDHQMPSGPTIICRSDVYPDSFYNSFKPSFDARREFEGSAGRMGPNPPFLCCQIFLGEARSISGATFVFEYHAMNCIIQFV